MAALDVTRAYVLAAVGAALDRMLGPKVLEGLLGEAARLGGRDHANALRDVPQHWVACNLLQHLPGKSRGTHSGLDQSNDHCRAPVRVIILPCPTDSFAAKTVCIRATALGIGRVVGRRSSRHERKCFISSTYI